MNETNLRTLSPLGYRGFFRGVKPLLVGIIPTRAIYFWSYGFSKKFFNENTQLGNSPMNHLISAFVAGGVSNTIMNPLWMVKTRYQLFMKSVQNGIVQAPQTYSSIIKDIWKKEGTYTRLFTFILGFTNDGCFYSFIR